ncbi:MAG: hypothetical protein ACREOW_06190 [Thermodesulfobacteriota bacterium]
MTNIDSETQNNLGVSSSTLRRAQDMPFDKAYVEPACHEPFGIAQDRVVEWSNCSRRSQVSRKNRCTFIDKILD